MTIGNFLETVETFDIVIDVFVAGAGASAGNGVSDIDQNRLLASKFLVLVVLLDTVNDGDGEIKFLQEVDPQFDVAALDIVDNFADVMEQTTEADGVDIGFDLLGQTNTDLSLFQGVGDHVLTIGRAEFEFAQHGDDFAGQVVNANGVTKPLAFLEHNPFDIESGMLEIFLDPGRLDAAVFDQTSKSDAGDFAADRVEARETNLTRRFLHTDINAGDFFENADIAALLADDAALGFLVGTGHGGNGKLGDVVGGTGAHGVDQDFAGQFIRFGLGLFLGFFDGLGDLGGRFFPDLGQENFPRFIGGQGGNFFQFFDQFFLFAQQVAF